MPDADTEQTTDPATVALVLSVIVAVLSVAGALLAVAQLTDSRWALLLGSALGLYAAYLLSLRAAR